MFVISFSVSVHQVSIARRRWVGYECKSASVCGCVFVNMCVLSCQSRYEVVNVYVRLCPGVCVCMRHREHWEGLSVFWRLSDWACHSGTGRCHQPRPQSRARQPAGPEHPDELTAGTAQAYLRPPRERKHLQPAIYLSVWLTMRYTWYNVHPQLTAVFSEFSGCL